MQIAMLAVFILGYILIVFEHQVGINKTAAALLTGVSAWAIYFISGINPEHGGDVLAEQLGEISGILFFLMAAMTLVEIIDGHGGFDIFTSLFRTTNRKSILWLTAVLTFFLSALLDNLATTIVMVLILRKLIEDPKDRWIFVGMTIIAANSGGAWSPIGDVTTTMLWIENRITPIGIITSTFLPSLVSFLIPITAFTFMVSGKIDTKAVAGTAWETTRQKKESWIVFILGLLSLFLVPVMKVLYHVPPVIGIFIGLSVLWVTVELMHRKKTEDDKHLLSVQEAIRRTDMPSVLFFFGIILAIDALKSVGLLAQAAEWLNETIGNLTFVGVAIGLVSTVLDNIPLVAATMHMYSFPVDHIFWQLLAYCAGTGGSILIIGSAAGLAAMGMEKIPFLWYLKKVTFWAFAGYLGGVGAFVLMNGMIP